MGLQRRTRPLVGYGLDNALQSLAPAPIIANRAPTTADTAELGTEWVYPAAQSVWVLASISNALANWVSVSGGAGVFSSLFVNPGPVTTDGIGAVNISADAVNTTINVGTGAGVKTVTIGSATGASATTIHGGAGGINILGGADDVAILGATIDIGDDATVTTLNIGNGAAVKTVTVGSVNTTSSLDLQSGTSGINLQSGATTAGLISMTPFSATAASPTAAVTANSRVIRATFTGFTTAHGGFQSYTINSAEILSTSAILVNVANLNVSTNGAAIQVEGIIQAAGSIVVGTINNGIAGGGGDLGAGDNVIISVWVIN